jgi:hypothetical protein
MKYYKKILCVLLLVLLTGCGEDVSVSYSGPALIEFPLSASTVLEDAGQVAIQTQLVGPHESTSVTVNFDIESSSTAVAGVHYEMITDGSIQIEPNSSSSEILIDVTGSTLNPNEEVVLVLTLTGGDHLPSENYKTHTMTIIGQ